MSTTPIEQMLDEIDYKPVEAPITNCGLPYATHEGILNIFNIEIKVSVLNDGRRIISEDDINRLFNLK